jgi:hypothetical protein
MPCNRQEFIQLVLMFSHLLVRQDDRLLHPSGIELVLVYASHP